MSIIAGAYVEIYTLSFIFKKMRLSLSANRFCSEKKHNLYVIGMHVECSEQIYNSPEMEITKYENP